MEKTLTVLVVKGAMHKVLMDLKHFMKRMPVEIIETDVNMDELLDFMEEEQVDMLITDIFIPGGDAMTLMEYMHERSIYASVVVYSELCTQTMIQAAFDLDADYYFVHGESISFVAKMLWRILQYREELKATPLEIEEILAVTLDMAEQLEREVTDIIRQVGIPANIKGYQYVREAILMSVTDIVKLEYVTKSIYPSIAQKYHTNGTSVERAIRHAITVAWNKGSMDRIYDSDNRLIGKFSAKPTNSQFIAMVVDHLRIMHELRDAG